MSRLDSPAKTVKKSDLLLDYRGFDQSRGALASYFHLCTSDTAGTSTCECSPCVRLTISSENGVVCPNEHQLSREEAVEDDFRVDYLTSYADQIAQKISEGVPVKSYLMWAWTDNFECKSKRISVLTVRARGVHGKVRSGLDRLQGWV